MILIVIVNLGLRNTDGTQDTNLIFDIQATMDPDNMEVDEDTRYWLALQLYTQVLIQSFTGVRMTLLRDSRFPAREMFRRCRKTATLQMTRWNKTKIRLYSKGDMSTANRKGARSIP